MHALRMQGFCAAEIGRALQRHRSTITRECERYSKPCNGYDQPFSAHTYAATRRSHSRRNTRFTAADWAAIDVLLRRDWSPEQIVGCYARDGGLSISHELINRYIWRQETGRHLAWAFAERE